jgi:hypothetical protein
MDRPYTIADVKPYLEAIAQSDGAPEKRLEFAAWLESRGCPLEANSQRDRLTSDRRMGWMGEFSYLAASAKSRPDFRLRGGLTFSEWYDSMHFDWWFDPRGERRTKTG